MFDFFFKFLFFVCFYAVATERGYWGHIQARQAHSHWAASPALSISTDNVVRYFLIDAGLEGN